MARKAIPILLILLGFIALLFFDQALIAGVCMVLGITMVINRFFPEKWEEDASCES